MRTAQVRRRHTSLAPTISAPRRRVNLEMRLPSPHTTSIRTFNNTSSEGNTMVPGVLRRGLLQCNIVFWHGV